MNMKEYMEALAAIHTEAGAQLRNLAEDSASEPDAVILERAESVLVEAEMKIAAMPEELR